MVSCAPRLPPAPCPLEEHGVASMWRQPVQTGSSGQLTKGPPEAVGGSPPRPLMNLFPLISGVAFEGKGRPRQLECPCLSSPGLLLLLPGHSFDRGLPDGPRVWTDISSLQLGRQFPFLLKLSVCLPASLPVQHFSLSGPGRSNSTPDTPQKQK